MIRVGGRCRFKQTIAPHGSSPRDGEIVTVIREDGWSDYDHQRMYQVEFREEIRGVSRMTGRPETTMGVLESELTPL